MNTPYVKEYNANGGLTNPIQTYYSSPAPNRSSRRGKGYRFKGNGKNHSLSFIGEYRFSRVRQIIKCWDTKKLIYTGETRSIMHYSR